jgi:hypothetical protein
MKSKSWRRLVLMLLPLTLLLPLSGCREQKQDIGDLAVILGAALEPVADGLRLTIELAHRDGVTSPDESVIISVTGKDWQDVEKKLAAKTDKQLYWGHMVLLVLSQDFTRQQLAQYMEQFYTDERLAPTIYVALAAADAEQLLAARFGEAVYISEGIAERLSLTLQQEETNCLSVEKCMQYLYREDNGIEQQGSGKMAKLELGGDEVRISYTEQWHE